MTKIINVSNSPRKNKRFRATFEDGKKIDFGKLDPTYGTYIDHKDPKKRIAYWSRHIKARGERELIANMIASPALLSLALLWGKFPTLQENIDYLNDEWDKWGN